jgi:predicted ATP-binding protein involved in virulence
MKLKKFKINKYKCIDHSGWIDVNDLTVIVGKNEAGKTTLLKGLHKLNPFKNEPYNIAREWPRGKRAERNDQQIVCTAQFELTATEITMLKELTSFELQTNDITATRTYSDEFKIDFSDIFNEQLSEEAETAVNTFLKKVFPTFIYMDDYRVFNGSAQLDQI